MVRQYNSDRGLGLTEQELVERFSNYELLDKYKGANRLSRHIASIGIRRAIDIYVNNPRALFKGAGIK